SVLLSTIRKWEHRMIQWMEAYCGGLNARDAQFQVKAFSSCIYTSHHHILNVWSLELLQAGEFSGIPVEVRKFTVILLEFPLNFYRNNGAV
ncbi:hypothetical protein DFP72DRAFT_807069, partial [Ephemerocybe angulata]